MLFTDEFHIYYPTLPPTTMSGLEWKHPETTIASVGPPVMNPMLAQFYKSRLRCHLSEYSGCDGWCVMAASSAADDEGWCECGALALEDTQFIGLLTRMLYSSSIAKIAKIKDEH